MKKFIGQFLKFGIVGIISFIVDYCVTMIVFMILNGLTGFKYSDLIGSCSGFVVSVIVNYILSMKFVFERREDLNKKQEFSIFIILSVIGLVLNLIVVWFLNHVVYLSWTWAKNTIPKELVLSVSKVVATAVVTVWNFISRKIFLEKK